MAVFLCLLALFGVEQSPYEVATVETTADAVTHAGALNGQAEVLNSKGPFDSILLRFRNAAIEHWTIQRALIAFHTPSGSAVPERLLVSGVQELWSETAKASPAISKSVSVPVRILKDGWCAVELPVKTAQLLAEGRSYSLALTPVEGTTVEVHSRRTGQYMPYLLVRGRGPSLRPVP